MNNRTLYTLITLASCMMGTLEHKEHQRIDIAKSQEYTCKNCYFYTGGTFCKKVKHCVNKHTPANRCGYFKKK